ncbi:MAG TPA: tyrosine--tRNA ligase [Thermoanaerobaculia bacterium]|nr:tyrosine--tRNA ligase [Thermoanaerobaculia bacterium]
MSLFDELEWRGLVYGATEGACEVLATEKVTGYVGFDPTAASLHVGSLLPIMNLARLQRFGHTPIALVGGGTGLIGDPSGKTQERQLMTPEKVEENLRGIRSQLERFLDFTARGNPARLVNNGDWLTTIPLTDFLRDIGKHFTVNAMLAKESVKRRLEQEDGISFTEFSYMLLQAYDFLVLFDRFGCTLQMGGSDQWGNIVAGADLIRRLRGDRSEAPSDGQAEKAKPLAHGVVSPLVTSSSGVKFGKTEAGAVWLDPGLTPPFRFYQFWFNTDDRDVIKYLRFFTWLTREEIGELEFEAQEAPERREAQRRLAREVTLAVHGETGLARAETATRILFGEAIAGLEPSEIEEVFADVPSSQVAGSSLAGEGTPLIDLLAASGLVPSKSEARRAIRGGGIYLNNVRAGEETRKVTAGDALGGRLLVLRKGRKDYHLVRVI